MLKSSSTFGPNQSKEIQDSGINVQALIGRLSVQPNISVNNLDGVSRPSLRKSVRLDFKKRPRFDRATSFENKGKLDLNALARRQSRRISIMKQQPWNEYANSPTKDLRSRKSTIKSTSNSPTRDREICSDTVSNLSSFSRASRRESRRRKPRVIK